MKSIFKVENSLKNILSVLFFHYLRLVLDYFISTRVCQVSTKTSKELNELELYGFPFYVKATNCHDGFQLQTYVLVQTYT